jgi:D-beta-D-heptose 7-phosphate kinase / D-beta-D-heptose 1-phosphate adenosyltransferase
MIVATVDLPQYGGLVTMADGGFDPLHHGHVAYLQAAAGLGLPVLCNVSSDEYVARKHRPVLAQEARGAILDALRFVDYVHLSQIETVAVLRLLRPRRYAKGADWRGRLPEEETAACAELGIEVVYLDTVLDSSSAILERYAHERAR